MLQVLELNAKWNRDWRYSPKFALEEKLGEKKLKRFDVVLDNLHISQIAVMNQLGNFNWVYNTFLGTVCSIKYLGHMYGVLDKTLKAFNVIYKAALKEVPELKEYYGDTEINIFDMMVNDIDYAIEYKMDNNKYSYIQGGMNDSDFIDKTTKLKDNIGIFDVVKSNFKSAEKLQVSLRK